MALNVLRLYTAQYPKQLPGGIEHAELEKRAGIGSLFARGAYAKTANTSGKESKPSMEKKTRTKRPAVTEVSAEAVKGTNLIQRIKMKTLTKNDKIRIIALGLCVLVFLASAIYIINNKMQSIKNKNLSDELASLYDPDGTTDISVDGYPKEYIHGFEALYQRNPDIAGWVKIPDTKLDYAVVQAEDNDKYHRADIDGKSEALASRRDIYRIGKNALSARARHADLNISRREQAAGESLFGSIHPLAAVMRAADARHRHSALMTGAAAAAGRMDLAARALKQLEQRFSAVGKDLLFLSAFEDRYLVFRHFPSPFMPR